MPQKTMLILKGLLIFSLFVFVTSCLAPSSKESYINGFEKFVKRVEQNHKKYNKKDWKWANTHFDKYRNQWYKKFKGEYSLTDQIKIKGLILEYNAYKNNEDFSKIIKELFNKDLDKIQGKVGDYIDNDMDEDLDKLIEGAEVIGDSAVKVLEDVIEKLDNTF